MNDSIYGLGESISSAFFYSSFYFTETSSQPLRNDPIAFVHLLDGIMISTQAVLMLNTNGVDLALRDDTGSAAFTAARSPSTSTRTGKDASPPTTAIAQYARNGRSGSMYVGASNGCAPPTASLT